MCENIVKEMSGYDVGLVILGLGHPHSMLLKLSKHYDVAGYGLEPF